MIHVYYAPAQAALSDDAVWRLSVWRLSDVCRIHPVDGRRVRPAGWMARIGWSGPARPAGLGLGPGSAGRARARAQPAWLNATAVRFRCRPGRGHIVAAARLQLVWFTLQLFRVAEIMHFHWPCQKGASQAHQSVGPTWNCKEYWSTSVVSWWHDPGSFWSHPLQILEQELFNGL